MRKPKRKAADRKYIDARLETLFYDSSSSARLNDSAGALGVRYSFLFMRAQGQQLSEITSLIESVVIRRVLDKVFPFETTSDALAYVETGRAKARSSSQSEISTFKACRLLRTGQCAHRRDCGRMVGHSESGISDPR